MWLILIMEVVVSPRDMVRMGIVTKRRFYKRIPLPHVGDIFLTKLRPNCYLASKKARIMPIAGKDGRV